MFCPHCGREVLSTDISCKHCLRYLGSATAGAPKYPSSSSYQYSSSTNGWAIAGLIFSFLIPILGLIFGLIGRSKVYETGSGEGLSKAAIIISVIQIIISVLFLLGMCESLASYL